jgi:Fe-S oxidoreductase/nitrate reductase gamma subunit
MDMTREIYWNVGAGAVLPMYLLTVAALAVLAWGIWRRLPVYRQGRPLERLDRLPERLRLLAGNLLGQTRVRRGSPAGMAHAGFFWGFALLFVGTLLVMLQADLLTPLFGVTLLQGGFYLGFSLILDLAGLAALLLLAGLLVRRFVIRPKGLETGRDDVLMHALLFAILLTGFVIEGARIAATELVQNPALADWSPVGKAVALILSGLDGGRLAVLHRGLWWLHLLLALALVAALPFTKLRHILTTSANALFADLGPKGALATLDLENDSIEQFGAARVTDLTWKDLFDGDACTSCQRCQQRCPAHSTDKPLSPMKLVKQIGTAAATSPEANLVATVGADALWSCTTCRACQDICPANVEHVNKIIDLRRNLTLMEGAFPGDEVRTAIANLEVNGNPFGLAFAGRGDWADGLPVVRLEDDAEVDLVYFVGCYASFDKRNIAVARSFVRLCAAAGLKVGILGKEEKCCGEPARKLGNEYLYQMLAAENIALLKGYGVKQIVTACPHCTNTLGRDYRDLGLDVPVEHYASFLARLLAEDRLPLQAGAALPATYHDSCYLGRYLDLYEAPRRLLAAAGGELVEMTRSRAESFCCSAGGGRILAEEKLGSRINVARVQMAQATGAPLLVANCPFCLTMFEDGIKTGGAEGALAVKDLAELLAARLPAS